MWFLCLKLCNDFPSCLHEKQTLPWPTRLCSTWLPTPLWCQSLSPLFLTLSTLTALAVVLTWQSFSCPRAFSAAHSSTLSAFIPGSHIIYSFTSLWPLLRKHTHYIYCNICVCVGGRGGNSGNKKKHTECFSEKWYRAVINPFYGILWSMCVNINRSAGHIIEYHNSNCNCYAFGHCSQGKIYIHVYNIHMFFRLYSYVL